VPLSGTPEVPAITAPVSQFCYNVGVDRWRVLWLPQTRKELGRLPRTERVGEGGRGAEAGGGRSLAGVPAFQRRSWCGSAA
jgi:hypothetical protein